MNCYYKCKTDFRLQKVKREYKKAAKKKKKKEERQSQIVEHSVELPSTGYYPPDSRRIVENVTKITSGIVLNATEIAASGVLNYPNYPFEPCSLQIHKISDSKASNLI